MFGCFLVKLILLLQLILLEGEICNL